MNQRAQYAQRNNGKTNWLSDERIKLLDEIGFVWTPNAKPESSGGSSKKTEMSSKKTEMTPV